jgi:quercetin dioxygenase-like cupin family protein
MDFPVETNTGTGERLRLLGIERDEEGREYLAVQGFVEPNVGPPMHVHFFQEERIRVETGRIAYQVLGEEPRIAEPGEEIVFPAGQVHRFWGAGEGLSTGRGMVRPVGNFPWFITRLHESIRQNGGRPGLFDGAFLTHHFRSEFDMVEIPAFVRRVVFPAVVALGHLLGKYRKYADAPEPIVRSGVEP